MDDQLEIQRESLDAVGSLSHVPPPMKKSDTRDSISSVDSDLSLSFDRRGSKGEEADLSDCNSGTDDNERLSDSQTQCDNSVNNLKDTADTAPPEAPGEEPQVAEDPQQEIITVSDDLAEKIAAQVEFYFSDDNIVKDAFLLKHVKRNKEGYVSLKLISSFKRVKHLSRDWRVVGASLRAKSTKLQVNEQGTKLRRLNPLPQYDQTLPSRTVVAARLPVDKITIESVAELFGQCGEIALIRILKPGHPVPAEIRQAIAKKSELGSDEECAVIEFTDSAAARAAVGLSLGEAKMFELQTSAGEKKRKQAILVKEGQGPTVKKSGASRIAARQNGYNSSSCPSGSDEEVRSSRAARGGRRTDSGAKNGFTASGPQPIPYQGPPSPEVWLPRRFSACVIGATDQLESGLLVRRLSGSSSDTTNYSNYSRRFSTCSSGSDTGYTSPVLHNPHQNAHNNLYPPMNYWSNQSRRYSCCGPSQSPPFNYGSPSGFYQTTRRGSTDCGPFLRRLSTCSRDSGYEATRRLSSCSSSSESCGGFRSRSNSGFVLMAHLPENVTRMPSGPDGTRGFGRNNNGEGNTSVQTCG
ncbi:la-related protein 6 [Diachasma alloeum]|uniref:la-related protein 6 n=1 Tax=Diachasma alloeum TaxID=454923 RepID=UPI00073815CA|nr:la-related protein 6 [Diachasma alloeum]